MAMTTNTAISQHTFRMFLNQLPQLTASQIEDLLSSATAIRWTRASLAEIEARTDKEQMCPGCSSEHRQKWGKTRTGVQRYRCSACLQTYSGLTGSAICGLHRHDLFLETIRNMFSDHPLSCRKLSRQLGKTKDTIWRWRMLILEAVGIASDDTFAGIVEVDETHQRESRKGSREWVLHAQDPSIHPAPPRHQWYIYKSGRVKMQRGLSRWQLPLLTITDRSGHQYLERVKNRSIPVIDAALAPVVAPDSILCTDGAAAYARFSKKNNMTHHILANKPGARVVQRAFHIQNVNSLHSRYDGFIRPFRGPAAKYLGRYLRWFLLRAKLGPEEAFRRILSA